MTGWDPGRGQRPDRRWRGGGRRGRRDEGPPRSRRRRARGARRRPPTESCSRPSPTSRSPWSTPTPTSSSSTSPPDWSCTRAPGNPSGTLVNGLLPGSRDAPAGVAHPAPRHRPPPRQGHLRPAHRGPRPGRPRQPLGPTAGPIPGRAAVPGAGLGRGGGGGRGDRRRHRPFGCRPDQDDRARRRAAGGDAVRGRTEMGPPAADHPDPLCARDRADPPDPGPPGRHRAPGGGGRAIQAGRARRPRTGRGQAARAGQRLGGARAGTGPAVPARGRARVRPPRTGTRLGSSPPFPTISRPSLRALS